MLKETQRKRRLSKEAINDVATKRLKSQEETDRELALSLQPRQCTICLEEMEADFFHTLACHHCFCRDCLASHLKTKLSEGGRSIQCPAVGCQEKIPATEMELLVENGLVEKYTDSTLDAFVQENGDNYARCMTPDCGYLFFYARGDTDFQCPLCDQRYCLQCRVPYHQDSTCKQYQKWSLLNGQSDDLFDTLVTGKNMKQCSRCRLWIQKADGCDHMKCRCGNEFCYRCGDQWPHKKCRKSRDS